MQAGEWGEYLERTDFEFENGKATLMDYKLIPINLKKTIKKEEVIFKN
ncbi:bifunctional UDP-sugar hydrolase/5'-nucleotidase periplasmic [Haemophilus parahaemolyticus HK385]|uniref:Bifunctional UDP-sugar hydrolase/5'-nucleotidase periplasmic n=2 Tax=Haemophilus parahaemolyticus TaxID=735 RepID=A0A377I3M1_HAEPH|nr:bifunctional UDP-sugar hydrolase/5'-nucleotidase periplasmic [Haemophilus parahaemolyticus]STO65556.1 bifunctional UDP-sugar hydrolase/5'-nucleotidase periplasmic [Haemophilus parahaemolyticus HK385]